MFLKFAKRQKKEDINSIRAKYEALKSEYFNIILTNNRILRAIRDRTDDLSELYNEYKSDINYGIKRAIEFNCEKSKEIQENN